MQSDPKSQHPAERCPRLKACLLKSWQPIPTWGSTIAIFVFLGVVLLILGGVLTAVNNSILEYTTQYDVSCTGKTICPVQITVAQAMTGPVFFYYALDNFYQNHRRYIKSRDDDQLSGTYYPDTSSVQTNCDPIVMNSDLGFPNLKGLDNTTVLDPNAPATPCGLIAWSVFNDTYTMTAPNQTAVYLNETGISWPSDKGNRYKNTPNAQKYQWIDMENEHFIVWMRTAGLPNFRKLWARIDGNLPAGTYTVNVINNYDVSSFEGKKYIVISTSGPFGGKNLFLSISYLAVGGACLLTALVFTVKYLLIRKQKQH